MVTDSREYTRAILKGDIKAFDELLSNGLAINYVTEKERWNFLHLALIPVTQKTSIDMIRHLISLGVEVNACDHGQWTPLHFAARNKYPQAIKELIHSGADVDPVNSDRVTPLRLTISEMPFSLDATRILLESDASPDHDECGVSIRELAKKICHGDNKIISDVIDSY